jgi:peptidoglycan/LPS O-acetylase OafA/YrhL
MREELGKVRCGFPMRYNHRREMSSSATNHFHPIDFKTRFPALDGIRALAVTWVFALHYNGGIHGSALKLVNAIASRGGMGVDLFFVLSGFLITGILYDTRSDSRFFVRFFGRRSIRIFPIFYSVLAILLLLTPLLKYQWRLGHLAFPFYLGNFAMAIDPSLQDVNSVVHPAASARLIHFWSLCVEEQFYLIWPFVVWFVGDRMRLIWTAGGLSVAALGLRIAFVLHFPPRYFEMWMQHLLPFRMDALLIGAVLALVLRGPNADFWQRSCKWLFMLGAAIMVVGSVLSPSLDSLWFNTVGYSAVAVAAAGLIGATLRSGSVAFRLFHLRPLRVLGKYSYGFYVYHLIWARAWRYLELLLATQLHVPVVGRAILDLGCFAATFIVAKLSYDHFEVRFLRLKKHFEYDSERSSHRHAFSLN